jgi:hypothetical protein
LGGQGRRIVSSRASLEGRKKEGRKEKKEGRKGRREGGREGKEREEGREGGSIRWEVMKT